MTLVTLKQENSVKNYWVDFDTDEVDKDVINIVSSTSKGNMVIFERSKLIIDCGVEVSTINNSNLEHAVFMHHQIMKCEKLVVTHKHQDHLNIKMMLYLMQENPRLKVILSDDTMEYIDKKKKTTDLSQYKLPGSSNGNSILIDLFEAKKKNIEVISTNRLGFNFSQDESKMGFYQFPADVKVLENNAPLDFSKATRLESLDLRSNENDGIKILPTLHRESTGNTLKKRKDQIINLAVIFGSGQFFYATDTFFKKGIELIFDEFSTMSIFCIEANYSEVLVQKDLEKRFSRYFETNKKLAKKAQESGILLLKGEEFDSEEVNFRNKFNYFNHLSEEETTSLFMNFKGSEDKLIYYLHYSKANRESSNSSSNFAELELKEKAKFSMERK